MRRCLVGAVARGWEAGEGEVVCCYGVGDLSSLATTITTKGKKGKGTYNRRIFIHLSQKLP